MDIQEKIALLYEKDTKTAYASLLELEALSDREDALLPFLGEFIGMLGSGQYTVRVRGFRLLCKQARWDTQGVIDEHIGVILAALGDEKPTAVRQMLQYLALLAPDKPTLHGQIAAAARAIDLSRFKDTMMPLIEKDIAALLRQLEGV